MAHLRKQFISIKQLIIKTWYILIFSILKLSPLEKGQGLHLKEFESPSSRMLCAKFGWNWNWPRSSWEKDFKIFSLYFLLLHNYPPLEKGGALHFLVTQGCFVPSLVVIWPGGSGEDDENLRQRKQQRKKVHLSLWLRWAKNQTDG